MCQLPLLPEKVDNTPTVSHNQHHTSHNNHCCHLVDGFGCDNISLHRLEEVESQHSNESREQMEVIGQLRQEVKEVTEAFRAQLHSLREEHQKVVDSLQGDLQVSRNTVTRLQQVVKERCP